MKLNDFLPPERVREIAETASGKWFGPEVVAAETAINAAMKEEMK